MLAYRREALTLAHLRSQPNLPFRRQRPDTLRLAAAAFLFGIPGHAQQQPAFRNASLTPEARINDLLSHMTLEEKIDCLGTNTAVPRLGVKSFRSSEGIHGVVQREPRPGRNPIYTTQFPQPPGMGETWDPEIVREAASVEGAEARYISEQPRYNRQILMLWGPQADLARDPRWGRSEEVYGEDPFFNGTMVVNFVKGLQGDDPNHWQTAALLKHFLANSNENLRTKSNSVFDQRLFWEYYSVPFRMGFFQGGARGVMASYNAWNGTPMAVNPILKSIVEDKWGVDVLSSDGGAVKPLVERTDLAPGPVPDLHLLKRAGADAVVDILAGLPPPKGLGPREGRIAYKTGTSYRFRDGWAIGFDGARVIGVWMGRADGGTCVTCVGMASAGILFRLFDQLAPAPLPARTLAPVFAGPPPPSLARLAATVQAPHASDPRITFPLAGARLLVGAASADIALAVDGGRRPYRWMVDGRPLESRAFAHAAAWHPSDEGFSTITVTDASGRSDVVRVRVVKLGAE